MDRVYLDVPSHWIPTSTPSLYGNPSHLSNQEQEQQIALDISASTPDALLAPLSWRPGFILNSRIFILEEHVKFPESVAVLRESVIKQRPE